jgi:two-component system, chemotaxis family, sensor kinase CheA
VTLDLAEFQGIFFDEANEHLGAMETALLALEHQPGNRELLNQIFRAAHSIKGGSGTFGYFDLLRFTHALEGLLHLLRDGVVSLDPPLADLLLRATDALRALVESTRRGDPPPGSLDALLTEIGRALAREPEEPSRGPLASAEVAADADDHDVSRSARSSLSAPSVRRNVCVLFAPGRDLFRQGMDPLLVVRDLCALGQPIDIVVDDDALPPLDALDPETCHLAWSVTMVTDHSEADIRDIFAFVEDISRIEIKQLETGAAAAVDTADAADAAASPAPAAEGVPFQPAVAAVAPEVRAPAAAGVAKQRAAVERSTLRVDTVKIDRLIDLVGELVIAQSMVTAALHGGSGAEERLREAVLAMDRNTRELQDRVMAVRMLPIGSVFNRFPRMVRDLSGSLGKQVDLVVSGEDIELDKGMVERLADPLTHLVRNAIDHGIESPEERRAAGKSAQGTLSIAAVHQGGNVVIDVSDDGRGLPLEKIRDKARALGLLSKGAEPSVEELHEIIFAPGFSTKDAVSDVSGRGVGMDVVKRNVEGLNGAVIFTSERGKGSRMRIRLPLTMAIIDGLTLRIGAQVFVLPLLDVVESLRPTLAQYQTILGRGETIRLRDRAVPLLRLHDVLGVPGAETNPCRALVCIVETRGAPVGLLVDELLGQAQVVVKTLETNFRRIDGVMGATILGDGQVALILDVQAIARRAATAGPEREIIHGSAGQAA